MAKQYGVKVTGTELIGLIPEECLLEAGRHFAKKQGIDVHEQDKLMAVAIDAMRLDDLCPFDAEQKVLVV